MSALTDDQMWPGPVIAHPHYDDGCIWFDTLLIHKYECESRYTDREKLLMREAFVEGCNRGADISFWGGDSRRFPEVFNEWLARR